MKSYNNKTITMLLTCSFLIQCSYNKNAYFHHIHSSTSETEYTKNCLFFQCETNLTKRLTTSSLSESESTKNCLFFQCETNLPKTNLPKTINYHMSHRQFFIIVRSNYWDHFLVRHMRLNIINIIICFRFCFLHSIDICYFHVLPGGIMSSYVWF